MDKHLLRVCMAAGLALLIGVLAGCGPGARGVCPQPGEDFADPEPGAEAVSLTLQNDICMSICVLLVSPDHCEYVGGTNWVEGDPLRSGESITREIPPGKYTVWVELCTDEYRADEGLRVTKDLTYSILDDPGNANQPNCGTSLAVTNQGEEPICSLWIGITDSVYTARNWLGSQPLQPGETLNLTLRPDKYYIRAEACDGTWLRSDVDLEVSGQQTWTVP